MPLPAHIKLVGLLAFAVAVVSTPRDVVWPYLVDLGVVLVTATLVDARPRRLAAALALEIPFVLFAVLIPFVAEGPRVSLGPVSVSEPGLWAAWSMLAKATVCILAAAVIGATTSAPALLSGLRRLRIPAELVQIASFMVRYAALTVDRWQMMTIARRSRGVASSRATWPALAASVGTLFIRTYERGERVHLAMVARGYGGAVPEPEPTVRADPRAWAVALIPAALAATASLIGALS